MNIEDIQNAFDSAKNKQDFIKKLNLDFTHKSGQYIDKELLKYTSLIGYSNKIDISANAFKERYIKRDKEQYNNYPKICKYCNNPIPYNRQYSNYCSTKCGTSYANAHRIVLDSTKAKTSNTLKNKYLAGNIIPHNQYGHSTNTFKLISTCIDEGILYNRDNIKYVDKPININRLTLKTCKYCGKQFYPNLTNNGDISISNFCSDFCKNESMKLSISKKVHQRIQNGTFKGWQTRNITSYPENFWMNVLTNNDIQYVNNYFFNKKYFLDFYIIKNNIQIDLEIDGKQHEYEDRKQHDLERDQYIQENNLLVYRIKWNEISSETGSNLMKFKINTFLKWYNEL